ncbi:hypothetical protein ASE00_13430 [Sphingomonas sp. Root710]|nr:hypothetical protein ASE00_13430 [Sphingomonas sp. Root710]
MDRQIFAVLMPAIKMEFGYSDSVLGLISGLGFAVTYSIFAIPLGRLADRGNRKYLLVGCIAVWSAMTFLCGAARNLPQLLLARMGVGAGEAGLTPSIVPIISDLYDKRFRARAISLYPISGALGMASALPLGGWLVAEYGWRTTFHLISIPGFLLLPLMILTFRDITRAKTSAGVAAKTAGSSSLADTLRIMVSNRRLVMVLGAGALGSMMTAMNIWLPTFYLRSHGLQPVESGVVLGPLIGLGTIFGMFLGGFMIDKTSVRHGESGVLLRLGYIALIQAITGAAMLFSPSLLFSYVTGGFWAIASAAWAPATFSLTQTLVPERMRGTALAVMGLVNNVIGYGLGPFLTGAISQNLHQGSGDDSLRWALIALCVTLGLSTGLLYFIASRTKQRQSGQSPAENGAETVNQSAA